MATPPPRPGRSLPDHIGRYRILGRLGKGSMGIVYSAFDPSMNRRVAIKVMTGDLQDDPETSARFQREAHAPGQLVHRNIITIFEKADDDGRPYIVMELLDGQTLGDYLKRDGLLLEDKMSLMMQMCEGLREAHNNGIYHRDIKPGNLLVADDGSLKIVDFGIARIAASSMTVTGLIVGTPDYMAPEQARGEEVDQRSDIFSAGAVFYYMLTGRKPFAAAGLPAVLSKVQHEDPLPIRESEAPLPLVQVVLKALAKSPQARYQTVGEMITDLARVSREIVLEIGRISKRVRLHVDVIEALEIERHKWCAELGVAPGAPDVQQLRDLIAPRYSMLSDWLDGRSLEPLRYAATQELLHEVTEVRTLLEGDLALVRQGAADLRYAAGAASAGKLHEALDYLDAVRKQVPACLRSRDEAVRLRALLAAKQAAEDRARALVAEAQAAAERGEWAMVFALTEQAMAADRQTAGVDALRERSRKELDSESGRRRLQSQRALDRAEKLKKKGRYAEAVVAVREAKGLDPASPAAAALEERIRTAQLDAERASDHERRSSEAVATARRTFDSGAGDKAIADLRAFLEREPESPGVAAALSTLADEVDRTRAHEQRRAKSAELAAAAEIALLGDDPERASGLAKEALQVDGRQPLARKIQAAAAGSIRERLLRTQRQDQAARALEGARALLSRGSFAAARELARTAASLNPADPQPQTLLAAIDEQEATARAQEARGRDARRRANATSPVLAMALAAEDAQDFIRADWLAQNALAIDPDCIQAREIIDRVRAKLSAQPELADETVPDGPGGLTSDPDKTIHLSPPASVWRRFADVLGKWRHATAVPSPRVRPTSEPPIKQP